jgi:hypothetical protein
MPSSRPRPVLAQNMIERARRGGAVRVAHRGRGLRADEFPAGLAQGNEMRRTCWPRPGRRRVHLDGRSGRADEMIAAGPPKQCRRISGDGTGGPHEHSWVRVPMCIAWAPDVGTGCLRGAAEFGELVDRDRECLSGHEGAGRCVGREEAALRRHAPLTEGCPCLSKLDDTRNSDRESSYRIAIGQHPDRK